MLIDVSACVHVCTGPCMCVCERTSAIISFVCLFVSSWIVVAVPMSRSLLTWCRASVRTAIHFCQLPHSQTFTLRSTTFMPGNCVYACAVRMCVRVHMYHWPIQCCVHICMLSKQTLGKCIACHSHTGVHVCAAECLTDCFLAKVVVINESHHV